jgi:glutamine synthetase
LGVKLLVSPDGSSIRGFTAQRESDLRLGIDCHRSTGAQPTFFGPGKLLVFGDVIDKGGTPYAADIRGVLKTPHSYRQREEHARGSALGQPPMRIPTW